MDKQKCYNTKEYFPVIIYISLIILLTSIGLIYSSIHHGAYVYLVLGIAAMISGVIGLIEGISKKRIYPHMTHFWLGDTIGLILVALGVYILITGSMNSNLNLREKMVCILLFTIGFHALHLRGFIKAETKKE